MAKNKYYVVWKGITPGVYDNWGECKAQVDGQDGAKYKSFETKEEMCIRDRIGRLLPFCFSRASPCTKAKNSPMLFVPFFNGPIRKISCMVGG